MRSQASNTEDHLVLEWEIRILYSIHSKFAVWGLKVLIAARWNAIIQMILVSFSHFIIGDNIFIISRGKIAM